MSALLLASCAMLRPAPLPPWCVTTCGLRLLPFDIQYRPTCAELQAVEDAALVTFARAAAIDSRFATACARLAGYSVKVGPPSFPHPDTRQLVNGLTLCDHLGIYVGHRAPLSASALAHELAHAIQDCAPLAPRDAVDPAHSNWADLYDAGVQ